MKEACADSKKHYEMYLRPTLADRKAGRYLLVRQGGLITLSSGIAMGKTKSTQSGIVGKCLAGILRTSKMT